MKLRDRLVKEGASIAVFGSGYLGYSDAAHYARQGVKSLLVDIDPAKVDKINGGDPPYPELAEWLGFELTVNHKSLIRATQDWKEALSCPVCFVCVNTERDGEPWQGAVVDVAAKLALADESPLVIVESTLTPGWTDAIFVPALKPGALLAVAPRRDWFTLGSGMNLESVDRVVGATSPEALEEAVAVLGMVSRKINRASSYRTAEMVKAVENAYRYIGIAFSYELALAYPEMDVREILRLAGTKWNLDTYWPSLGVGGYCIRASSDYVQAGTTRKTWLGLLRAARTIDDLMPKLVAREIAKRKLHSVCILGLAYRGGLKVHAASPSLRLIEALREYGDIRIGLSDPLYGDDEIRAIAGVDPAHFPEDMSGYECVVLACDHAEYIGVPVETLLDSLKDCKLVLDCHELWTHHRERLRERGVDYHAIGDAGWKA